MSMMKLESVLAARSFPPPERGRVRVGVDRIRVGVNLAAKHRALIVRTKNVTPSRFASKRRSASRLADLPLSGGGEPRLRDEA
jgi:hypothetical protein